MKLPSDLRLSQGSLQDFVDCRRRFQLRHLQRLAWPAVEAEPALEQEQHVQQGAQFHRLVHQHLLGVPTERLSAMAAQEPALAHWWQEYLHHAPVAALPGRSFPEVTLSVPLSSGLTATAGWRLVATYDLLVISADGQAVIFDWKTSRRRPGRQWLAERLQTQVYPYLLVEAGAELTGGHALQPDQVSMIYWFAGFPGQPERFAYSARQHDADRHALAALAGEILALGEQAQDFPLTPFQERCRFCVYRSLCDRGVRAGSLQENQEDAPEEESILDFELDFEQIAEIAY